jgi:hypothetical protein
MENFSWPLEMMQCQEHKSFTGTLFSEGRALVEDKQATAQYG